MAHASNVGFRLNFSQIPFISCARHYAEQGTFPGGSADNRLHFGPHVTFHPALDEPAQMLLFDAQTSGGLLLAVPREKQDTFLARANEIDQPAWVIGEVGEGEGIEVMN
jgi:selenide,water dikinase